MKARMTLTSARPYGFLMVAISDIFFQGEDEKHRFIRCVSWLELSIPEVPIIISFKGLAANSRPDPFSGLFWGNNFNSWEIGLIPIFIS